MVRLIAFVVVLILVQPISAAPVEGESGSGVRPSSTSEVVPRAGMSSPSDSLISAEVTEGMLKAPAVVEPTFFSWAYWQQGPSGATRSEIARNFLLALVAVLGLGFGLWRAWTAHLQALASSNQARIAEQGLFTGRFATAAQHLGSEQLSVRLGGIYALWRLAEDSPTRDMTTVVDVLCAFARRPTKDTDKWGGGHVRPDVLAVVKLLGGPDKEYRQFLPEGYVLDLSGAWLGGADLTGIELMNTNFTRAALNSTVLRGAILAGANFTSASLIGADFSEANLAKASFIDARLPTATLWQTNLSGGDLSGADLKGACVSGADLAGAKLTGAHLNEIDLAGANLSKSILEACDLTDAKLAGANTIGINLAEAVLDSADLSDIDLSDATGLIQDQLARIRYHPSVPPKLPSRLQLPPSL